MITFLCNLSNGSALLNINLWHFFVFHCINKADY